MGGGRRGEGVPPPARGGEQGGAPPRYKMRVDQLPTTFGYPLGNDHIRVSWAQGLSYVRVSRRNCT